MLGNVGAVNTPGTDWKSHLAYCVFLVKVINGRVLFFISTLH